MSLLFRSLLIIVLALACGCNSDNADNNAGSDGDADMDTLSEVDTEPAAEEDAEIACPTVEVTLPEYPYAETALTEVSMDFLNQLAVDYVCGLDAQDEASGVDFLLRYAPLRLFEDMQTQGPAELKKTMWILHISGYFGGIWLKAKLNEFNPSDGDDDSESGHMGGEPAEDGGLSEAVEIAQEAIDAAEGDDEALLAFNKTSLLGFLIPKFGIASNFGYNKGYLLQIYDNPPESLTSPEGFVACDGVLWCDYATQHMSCLPGLKGVSDALGSESAPYDEIGEKVRKSQDGAESMGRQVWGSFLDYSGMPQDFYEDLLDVSAAFLEVVQAAGLLSAKAVAEEDTEAGRQAAYLQSGIIIWLSAYMGSFTSSPPPDAPLPELVIN